MKRSVTYNAHETERMKEVNGAPLAPFSRRAAAFIIDFLLAFGLFLAILIPGGKLINALGIETGDINLKFSFENWYSLVVIVAYFALMTYWGNGKTPGKWLTGIRVVSLVHPRLSLWHSLERALGYGASLLEFGFGFVQYFIHPNRRTVHDRIAENNCSHRSAQGTVSSSNTNGRSGSREEKNLTPRMLFLGVLIAWIDAQPGEDDTGVTAAAVVTTSGLYGLFVPRHPSLL